MIVICNKKHGAEIGIAICLAIFVIMTGCRRAPASSPQYYEREVEQMRLEKLKELRDSQKPLKDGYPWRSNKPQPSVPCRIKTLEKSLQVEIDYIYETVHGERKSRLRLRD